MTESLYVLEPGSYIRKEGDMLKIVKDSHVTGTIPADGLKKLMIVGYISLSGSVLDFLIKKRIETVFITPSGRFRARLVLDEHRHVALRSAQYRLLDKFDFSLEMAKRLVTGKTMNMYRFLRLRARNYGNDSLKIAALKLKTMAESLKEIQAMEQLRGMEGAASREYFKVFPHLIRNEGFKFNGRNRRPPLDPINALLSFVYTLLTNEVLSAIKTVGLDPYLGSLHEIAYGRPSLACDLVEEFRSFMGDRFVLDLINKKAISSQDFIYRNSTQAEYADETEMKAKRPVEMKPVISRTLLSAYELMMHRSIMYPPLGKKTSYRFLILNQVQLFAKHLKDQSVDYRSFLWEI